MLIHTRQLVFHKEVRNKSKFISQIGICIFINAKSEIPGHSIWKLTYFCSLRIIIVTDRKLSKSSPLLAMRIINRSWKCSLIPVMRITSRLWLSFKPPAPNG